MGQLAKGLANEQAEGPKTAAPAGPPDEASEETVGAGDIGKQLERLKWFLWHGNVERALETIEDIEGALDLLSQDGQSRRKLVKALREFSGYIEANQNLIPNYGDRYRHGETISTAFAESTVNLVVSKRMVKKQQMQWSEPGAHHLLQVRTKVLNDEFRETFARWYPGMRTDQETNLAEKAA